MYVLKFRIQRDMYPSTKLLYLIHIEFERNSKMHLFSYLAKALEESPCFFYERDEQNGLQRVKDIDKARLFPCHCKHHIVTNPKKLV